MIGRRIAHRGASRKSRHGIAHRGGEQTNSVSSAAAADVANRQNRRGGGVVFFCGDSIRGSVRLATGISGGVALYWRSWRYADVVVVARNVDIRARAWQLRAPYRVRIAHPSDSLAS